MRKTLFTTVCALFIATASAAAAPSVNGPTGLINTPTADVLRDGQFSLGYYNVNEGSAGSFNLNLAKNLEIGITRYNYDHGSDKTLLNAKWSILPETVISPGLAVGVEDIGNERDRTAYVVASKALPLGFRIHAGVGGGRYDGGFAALEKTINPISIVTGSNAFPATTLIAEYDGKNMNYGARLAIIPGLKLDAGWRDHKGYAGLTLTY